MTPLEEFLARTKKKCEETGKKMAALELSIWNSNHEADLKNVFGFSDKEIAERKVELLNTANA